MNFADMGLHEAITRAVLDAGYTQATEVQHRAIAPAMAGQDLMVSASTGRPAALASLIRLTSFFRRLDSSSESSRRASAES